MTNRYGVSILLTLNRATKTHRYFKEVGSVMTRINKATYDDILDTCAGVYNLQTVITATHVRHFTGCTFYIQEGVMHES